MPKIVGIEKQDGIDGLRIIDCEIPNIPPHYVLIKNTALGINRVDLDFCNGKKSIKMPNVLGTESVGIVEEVGKDVYEWQAGDRVSYFSTPHGAFAEYRVVHQDFLVKVQDYLSDEIAAASLFKGAFANILLARIYPLTREHNVLITGVSGGIGHMLAQIAANHTKATVFGLTSSRSKIPSLQSLGCKKILCTDDFSDDPKCEKLENEIYEITKGTGIQVAYDADCNKFCQTCLHSLGIFGMYVPYGTISGPMHDIKPQILQSRSLSCTAPDFRMFNVSCVELSMNVMEISELIMRRVITPIIHKTYNGIDSVVDALKDIQDGKNMFSIVVKL